MSRFMKIARENNTQFLYDKETSKEYPLTIETLIDIANHLNDEILDYEGILVELGGGFKEVVENQDGLILGNVPTTQFNTVVAVMEAEKECHKHSNEVMVEKFWAFDDEGNLK